MAKNTGKPVSKKAKIETGKKFDGNYYIEFFKSLLRVVRKSSILKDKLSMWALLTRAWVVAAMMNLPRLVGMFTKSIPWF